MSGAVIGEPESDRLVIVTAADTSHARSLVQFLTSIRRFEPELRVIVYDLGLRWWERRLVRRSFPYELRRFDYGRYPPHLDISVNKGEYAWKPVIVNEVAAEHAGLLCWMDAGDLLIGDLAELRRYVRQRGFYSPHSSGTIADWTHPGMLAYFGLTGAWSGCARPNLNGACIAFDTRHAGAMALIAEWGRLALVKDCIAPSGSSQKNHRQDQALLSVLAYRSGLIESPAPAMLGFSIHADIDEPLRRRVRRRLKRWLGMA